ncbi:unnamed protein product [Somion occarium]|uniref:Uncharacterized protein n=1 Tax=Somion occarium TaxID=3059160 RepID=A0ABP1DJ81_9APHY
MITRSSGELTEQTLLVPFCPFHLDSYLHAPFSIATMDVNLARRLKWLPLTLLCVVMVGLSIPLSFWSTSRIRSCTTCSQSHWSIPELDNVVMHFVRRSTAFELNSPAWSNMLPSGGHLIYQGHSDGTVSVHTLAIFHQLLCVDVIRLAYVEESRDPQSPLARHCFNYLRESLLCQMDMREEQIPDIPLSNGFDKMCLDWEAVWSEAERNYQEYQEYIHRTDPRNI